MFPNQAPVSIVVFMCTIKYYRWFIFYEIKIPSVEGISYKAYSNLKFFFHRTNGRLSFSRIGRFSLVWIHSNFLRIWVQFVLVATDQLVLVFVFFFGIGLFDDSKI